MTAGPSLSARPIGRRHTRGRRLCDRLRFPPVLMLSEPEKAHCFVDEYLDVPIRLDHAPGLAERKGDRTLWLRRVTFDGRSEIARQSIVGLLDFRLIPAGVGRYSIAPAVGVRKPFSVASAAGVG